MERIDLLNILITDDTVHSMEVIGLEYCEKICLPNKPLEWRCGYHIGERNCKDAQDFIEDYFKLKNH